MHTCTFQQSSDRQKSPLQTALVKLRRSLLRHSTSSQFSFTMPIHGQDTRWRSRENLSPTILRITSDRSRILTLNQYILLKIRSLALQTLKYHLTSPTNLWKDSASVLLHQLEELLMCLQNKWKKVGITSRNKVYQHQEVLCSGLQLITTLLK